MGEFGMVTAKGTAHARELMALVASEERIPALAREALHQLVEQIRDTERRIEELDRQILAMAKARPVARRLITIPSIGPYSATAIVAMVSDAQQFASARHFAAWLGLAPRQHSTGGKERIGRISKRGDSYVRRLLIHGARAVVQRVRAGQVKGAWIAGLLARRPFNIATVALANKTARIAWAVMSKGEAFRAAG
jgi:transposase